MILSKEFANEKRSRLSLFEPRVQEEENSKTWVENSTCGREGSPQSNERSMYNPK